MPSIAAVITNFLNEATTSPKDTLKLFIELDSSFKF
jgi:hypothetical protein